MNNRGLKGAFLDPVEREGLIRRFAPHPAGALCASKLVSPICRTLLFMFEGSNSYFYSFSQLRFLSSNPKLAEREGLIRRFAPHPVGALCASKLVSPICRTLLSISGFEFLLSVVFSAHFAEFLRLIGGEGGIRTLEGLQTLAGFQDQCIQPLCHLSK
jgi:hypothetical protein